MTKANIVSAGPLSTDPSVDPGNDLLELDRTIQTMSLEASVDNPEGFISINIFPVVELSQAGGRETPASLQLLEEIVCRL